jgi:anti-sigma factor RsiW
MTADGGHPWAGTHLTCQEVVEIVSDYLDDVLPPAERQEFERHLVACDGCTAYLEQMRTTVKVAGRLHVDEVPAPLLEGLLAVFRDAR